MTNWYPSCAFLRIHRKIRRILLILTTHPSSEIKPVSAIVPRAIAGLIDALLITVVDCLLMYSFWIAGMAAGILDHSADHWLQILYTAPLFFLDGLFAAAIPFALIYLNSVGAFHERTATLANTFFASTIAVNWLYHAYFESSGARGTLGKAFLDVVVVDAKSGRHIGFLRASLRHFCKLFSALIACIGFLSIFGKRKKRMLHDLISRCEVSLEPSNQAGYNDS